MSSNYISDALRQVISARAQNRCEYYCEVVGQTPTGRATVLALRLNRKGVVNLRRILAQVGEHPP